MKKIALTSAIMFASISAAQAAPTVYGKVFMGVDYINESYDNSSKDDKNSTKLQSHSSRIGFKGEEALTQNTNVVYQLEYGVKADDNSTQFKSRNTYLGLSNKQYGTLLAGRHDTPFKLSKGNVAQFDDYTETDLGKLMVGDVRADNVIAYKSPTMATLPVTFMAAVSLNECDTSDGKCVVTPATETKPAVLKDKKHAYSTSLVYDQNGVYLAGAYDKDVASDSAWRVTGAVDMEKMNMGAGLTLGAMYQQADFDTEENEQSWLVSGKYKVAQTPWAVKAQYVKTNNRLGVKDAEVSEMALGGEYSFNKATKAHMYVAQINTDKVSDKTIVGAGLEYKF